MGRTRKYATEEEAHEAKKQQMRENYQKRKAAKEAAAQEAAKPIPQPKTVKQRNEKSIVESIKEPPSAEYLKMTKEELLEKFGTLLDSF